MEPHSLAPSTLPRTLSQSLPTSRRNSLKARRAAEHSVEDEFDKYFAMAKLHEALAAVDTAPVVPVIRETRDPCDTDTTSLSSESGSETSLERTGSLHSGLRHGKHRWKEGSSLRRHRLRRSFHVKCPPNSVASGARRGSLPSEDRPPERPPHIRLLRPAVDSRQVRSYVITSKGLKRGGEPDANHRAAELITVQPGTEPAAGPTHRVLVLGRSGVGKKALIREFMMPDHFFMSSADDDSEKFVSILLDGEESTLEFVDLSDQEVDAGVRPEHIDAYVVVYSVEDRKSFLTAVDKLTEIGDEEGREVAVILVANKSDLVRTRVVFEDEGKNAAKKHDCKYIEVSAAIDHKIDELLVGILKQIRLINDKFHRHNKRRSKVSHLVQHVAHKAAGDLCCPLGNTNSMLGKIFGKPHFTSKSCENLYVL